MEDKIKLHLAILFSLVSFFVKSFTLHFLRTNQSHLDFLICARSVLVHHQGTSDVTELVTVAMQQQEGPTHGRDFPLDSCCGPHQLHTKGHLHAAVKVQLICIICLHLAGGRQRERKQVRGDTHLIEAGLRLM